MRAKGVIDPAGPDLLLVLVLVVCRWVCLQASSRTIDECMYVPDTWSMCFNESQAIDEV